RKLAQTAPADKILCAMEAALAFSTDRARADVLCELLDSQREHLATEGDGTGMTAIRNRVVLHRDWVGARQAAVRAFGILLLIGVVFILSGWSVCVFVLIGAAVMII